MKTASPCIMTINGGSSSIKFALFETGESLKLTLRTGLSESDYRKLSRSQQIDLILLDMQMPIMNGYEAVKALRAEERTAGIKIIAVTSTKGDRGQAAELRTDRNCACD